MLNERDQNKIYYAIIHDTRYHFLLPLKIYNNKSYLNSEISVFVFNFIKMLS